MDVPALLDDVTFLMLSEPFREMAGCQAIDPSRDAKYYDVAGEMMAIVSCRQPDFMVRMDYLHNS
jgi:hypothetical protein